MSYSRHTTLYISPSSIYLPNIQHTSERPCTQQILFYIDSMVGHRRTKSSGPPPPHRTLVVDNGAYTIKAGFSSSSSTEAPHVIPNCMARDRDRKVYIGSQLGKCKDFGDITFRRPVEKGYLVNWEAEKEIWEHEFFDA